METFLNICKNKRGLIADFLSKDKNSKYDNLVKIFKSFEEKGYYLDNIVFNTRKPVTKPYQFYEIPTYETIMSISRICEYFKTSKMLEVGAGCALLSKVVNNMNLNVKFEASDLTVMEEKYEKVEKKGFKDIHTSDPIVISWLHSLCQREFAEMIGRNRPEFIIHVGAGPGGCCYDDNFIPLMTKLGYNYELIPVKTLSIADYFKLDEIRKTKNFSYSRTCITLFTREKLNVDFKKICGQENLHTYIHLTKEYTLVYDQQDGKYYPNNTNEITVKYNTNDNIPQNKLLLNIPDDLTVETVILRKKDGTLVAFNVNK